MQTNGVARLGMLLGVALAAIVGCTPSHESPSSLEDQGEVRVAFTQIPPGLACLRITAAGSTRTTQSSTTVSPGQSTASLSLSGLPVGSVSFRADAFAVACAAVAVSTVPSWISDPVVVVVARSEVAEVALVMKRNGRGNVSVDFVDDSSETVVIDEDFGAASLSAAWQSFSYAGPRGNGQTGPAGHSSLTDHAGFLRYYPDPMTYRSPFLRDYAVQPGSVLPPYDYDPGHELARSIAGSAWTLETKVTYHIPESANACDFAMDLTFGDGSVGTRTVALTRYGNGSYVTIGVSLAQRTGQWQTTYEPDAWGGIEPSPAPTDRTEQLRLQRSGGLLRAFRSLDGVTWTELWSRDMGNALDGQSQRVAFSGGAWFQPEGCYADYDYLRVTTP